MSIETVLRKHQIDYEPRAYPAYVCLCGWDGAIDDNGGPDDGLNDSADGAIAHVAATIREHLTSDEVVSVAAVALKRRNHASAVYDFHLWDARAALTAATEESADA